MTRQLHLLRRLDEARPDPLGSDVMALAVEHEIRILELFDAPLHVATLDMSLSQRDIPEVTAAMHWAEEVHVHHVAPQQALIMLPYVRPATLEDTELVLHGPWAVPNREIKASGARLHRWPGPVKMHRPPQDHGFVSPLAEVVELASVMDPNRAGLIPRSCGPIPLELEDGSRLAVVGIGADVPEELRESLRRVLPAAAAPGVQLEIVDETTTPVVERAESRRAMQAYIIPSLDAADWSRWMVEAVAQHIPIICLGDPVEGVPDDVVFTESDDSVQSCAAIVTDWCTPWQQGNAAPLNAGKRRAWLAARGVGRRPTGPSERSRRPE